MSLLPASLGAATDGGAESLAPESSSTATSRWRNLQTLLSPGLVLSFIIISVLLISAVLPAVLRRYNPYQENLSNVLAPPSSTYWFGTDYLGRDIYSRLIEGTGMSVASALLAVAIGVVAGSAIGLFAGHKPGTAAETLLMRLIDTLIAIPGLLLSMAIVVALGFSTVNAAIAVGVSSVAVFARLMRSEVLRIKNQPYLESAELVGSRGTTLVLTHILPNAWSSVLALAVLQFGAAIMSIAALAFLGYGDSPPSPEWGVQVSDGRDYIFSAPWMVAVPSIAIVVTVVAFNRLSSFLREVADNE